MYAKAAMNVRKLEKEIVVPPIGRMNTIAKSRGGLQSGSVVLSVKCQHGDAEYFPKNCKVFIANKSI